MSYRNIVIEGETYQYKIGRTFLKVKGFPAIVNNQVGELVISDEYADYGIVKTIEVRPEHVADYIKEQLLLKQK